MTLKEILYVPEIEYNLLSESKTTKNGCKEIFQKNKCNMTLNGLIILEGKLKKNLYEAQLINQNKNTDYPNLIYNCSNKNCIELVTKGHWNYQPIKNILSKQLANGIKIDNYKPDTVCEPCIRADTNASPFPKSA